VICLFCRLVLGSECTFTNKTRPYYMLGATKILKKEIDKRISAAGAVLQKI
jgi:hypothetical protein